VLRLRGRAISSGGRKKKKEPSRFKGKKGGEVTGNHLKDRGRRGETLPRNSL